MKTEHSKVGLHLQHTGLNILQKCFQTVIDSVSVSFQCMCRSCKDSQTVESEIIQSILMKFGLTKKFRAGLLT